MRHACYLLSAVFANMFEQMFNFGLIRKYQKYFRQKNVFQKVTPECSPGHSEHGERKIAPQ